MREFHHPAELTDEEEKEILAGLNSPRFVGKAVAQVCTILLGEGHCLASESAMHRLLRKRGTSGERRQHAARPAKKKPDCPRPGRIRCGRGISRN